MVDQSQQSVLVDPARFPTPAAGLLRRVPGGAMVACNAVVTGDAELGVDCNVWFGSVIRADEDRIRIGARTNVQDGSILHTDTGFPLDIGADCTIGHGAIIHGVHIGDGCLIGMRCVILGGARIGAGSVVAAGAVVKEGADVPPGSLVVGVPGRVIRPVGEREQEFMKHSVPHYVELARRYLDAGDAESR